MTVTPNKERPGASTFRHFVKHIQEHQTAPDMHINGNMGVFHQHAETLLEVLTSKRGYAGFEQALNYLIDENNDVMHALSEGDSGDKPVGKLLSEVTPKPVRWLWLGRLPYGKLVMADGDPGLGKTSVLFDIGARLTKGLSMPGETARTTAKGIVLVCLEDGLDDTIQPRMAKAGADLTKVVSIGYLEVKDANGRVYERPFNLAEDLPLLEAAIQRVDAGLIIIDPVMAILGGKDTYKDNEVRSTLAPLKALAERTGACVAMIRHVTKGNSDKLIYQGGGSIAFIGLSRVGLMFSKNPDDEEQCILTVAKNNLCLKPPKLLYQIVSDVGSNDERPYVRWEGITTITDQELTHKPQDNQGDKRTTILKYLKGAYPVAVTPQ